MCKFSSISISLILILVTTESSFSVFLRITAELSLFEVTGLASKRLVPTLLSSRKAATGAGTPLLSILFETNPLDESANQRFHVESQPLEIIYDAVSSLLLHIFKHEENKITKAIT